jgi:membrane associated rhomboid family serine protease
VLFFAAYKILSRTDQAFSDWILMHFRMPTSLELFLQRPYTIISSILLHTSAWGLISNLIGLIIFGNFTSVLLSKRMVAPLFILGGLFGNISLWFFKEIPLLAPYLEQIFVSGSSAGIMALAVISAFYMPDQIVRLYGVFPLKLKVLGRAVLFLCFFMIFFKVNMGIQVMSLGGALNGYFFLLLMKRGKPKFFNFSFAGSSKLKKSAKIEMKIIHNKPLTDEEYKEVQISQEEYLDHLLDKIGRNGIGSLTKNELDFLKKFGNNRL